MTEDPPATDHAANDPQFVEKTWKEAGATFPPVSAEVDGEPCRITSVTARPAGSTYVNLTIGDEKRSLIAANHIWTREQQEINDSAFFGVLSGAPADAALRYEAAPKTIAEARTKDRARAKGKRYFLRCREGDDSLSWRLVSGVEFGNECLDAISHFDWGEKQRFGFDIIAEIVDAQNDEKLSIEELRDEVSRRPAPASTSANPMSSRAGLAILFLVAALGAGAASYFLLGRFLAPAQPPANASANAPQPKAGGASATPGQSAVKPRSRTNAPR
jgi:hypothetical protein